MHIQKYLFNKYRIYFRGKILLCVEANGRKLSIDNFCLNYSRALSYEFHAFPYNEFPCSYRHESRSEIFDKVNYIYVLTNRKNVNNQSLLH